jgi:hypothetical protein
MKHVTHKAEPKTPKKHNDDKKTRLVFDITPAEYELFTNYAYSKDMTLIALFRSLCYDKDIFHKKKTYIKKSAKK